MGKKNSMEFQPCMRMMDTKVAALAYGELGNGVLDRLVRAHVKRCNKCKSAIEALKCYNEAVTEAHEEYRQAGNPGLSELELGAIVQRLTESNESRELT